MIWLCASIKIFSALISAFSQILLKKSTMVEHGSLVREYVNVRVIVAYMLFSMALLLNIFAFSGLEYRLGSVLNATAYLFTMVLSVLLLHDKLNWRCVCGNLLIFIGIVIYVVF